MSGLSGFLYFHLWLVVEQTVLSINIAGYTFPLPPGGPLSICKWTCQSKTATSLILG
jgi:hypothetical protein